MELTDPSPSPQKSNEKKGGGLVPPKREEEERKRKGSHRKSRGEVGAQGPRGGRGEQGGDLPYLPGSSVHRQNYPQSRSRAYTKF